MDAFVTLLISFTQTLLGTARDVLPIAIILFGFQFLVIRRPLPNLRKRIIGFVYVLLGLSLFLLGLENALFPLGRVMAQNPDVLLLDEPLGALDALTRERLGLDVLRMWSQKKQTALMVTHDINEAVLLADRVLVMSQRPGQIVADIRVDLPRPRHLEQTYLPEFLTIAKQVRAAINSA